ncbi:MAG: hypothetical protein IKB73_01705 [Ruminococcus sp.]|nr:hypothetical protein [Ruminococcus sp.]
MKIKALVKILPILLTLVLIVTIFSISTSGYSVYDFSSYRDFDNIMLFQNDRESVIVGCKNNTVSVDGIHPQGYNITLTMENHPYSYTMSNSTLVMTCPIKSTSQNQIAVYNINTDRLSTFYVNIDTEFENSQIAFSRNNVYLITGSNTIKRYSLKGKLLDTYTLDVSVNSITSDPFGNVYAGSDNGLYILNSDVWCQLSDKTYFSPIRFIGDNTLVDGSGKIYEVFSDKVYRLSDTVSTVHYPSGGVFYEYTLAADGRSIIAINNNTENPEREISLNGDVAQINCVNNYVIALTYDGNTPNISVIPFSDFSEIRSNYTDYDENYAQNNEHCDDNNSSENSHMKYEYDEENSHITSDVYFVDNTRMRILDISSPTTVAQFKKNMNYDDFNVEFFRNDGKKLTSGKVGTATVARFYNDRYVYEYELAVTGDITGEGNVNTRDRKLLFDATAEVVTFTGVYVDAADFYDNDILGLRDLVLWIRRFN